MLSVRQAEEIIHHSAVQKESQTRSLEDIYGYVLGEDIMADRDYPPENKSLMDGLAVYFNDWQNGVRTFKIIGEQPAGSRPLELSLSGECVHVMTGALLPKKADCVIPIEQTKINQDYAQIAEAFNPVPGQYIQVKGSQARLGDVLIQKGTRILSPQLAILASVGKSRARVNQEIKVAVISTGDELVAVNEEVSPYQTRKSNSYFIQSALEGLNGCTVQGFHFADDKYLLLKEIKNILDDFDLIVSTGGVSMGKYDFLPEVLNELKVTMLFHKVKQRPGKPLWFGQSSGGKLVFALPGNPISTQVCLCRYVIPAIKSMMGVLTKPLYAQLENDVKMKDDFTSFLPVKVACSNEGVLIARPADFRGSGDVTALGESDGFIEMAQEKQGGQKGAAYPLYLWNG